MSISAAYFYLSLNLNFWYLRLACANIERFFFCLLLGDREAKPGGEKGEYTVAW